MKKLFLVIIIFLLFPNTVKAIDASIVIDAESGRILSQNNIHKPVLIASTTKIMSAIIAIENEELNKTFIVGKEIKEVYGSSLYLKEGEKIKLKDLLYGLLLRSGNDASMVIAKNIFSYDKFIKLMNQKAIEIGMKNTKFFNPHGLDNETQNYSSAYDMAILMQYAFKNLNFKKIIGTKKYSFETNMNKYELYTKNTIILDYKYCLGAKTGYTEKAHKSLVSYGQKDNKKIIIATFNDPTRFKTHINLYKKYFNEYERYKILDKYNFVMQKEKYYKEKSLYIKEDVYMLLNKEDKNNMKVNIVLNKKIKKDKSAGKVEILINKEKVKTDKIYAFSKKTKWNKIKSLFSF